MWVLLYNVQTTKFKFHNQSQTESLTLNLHRDNISDWVTHPVYGQYLRLSHSPCVWTISQSESLTLCMDNISVWVTHPVYGQYPRVSQSPCVWAISQTGSLTLWMESLTLCMDNISDWVTHPLSVYGQSFIQTGTLRNLQAQGNTKMFTTYS